MLSNLNEVCYITTALEVAFGCQGDRPMSVDIPFAFQVTALLSAGVRLMVCLRSSVSRPGRLAVTRNSLGIDYLIRRTPAANNVTALKAKGREGVKLMRTVHSNLRNEYKRLREALRDSGFFSNKSRVI